MKRDGRSLDHQTLEAIRLMAVERVREGERASTVVASFGFHRTTIYRWITAASQPGIGLKALHARPAPGRPRSLTPGEERQVFRWINGRDPAAIEAWRRDRFPAIARQAKSSGGDVYFWDESGFRADTVHGKTWGKRGETPVVERAGQRQSISAASAVNARGGFWYCTYHGGLNA